jgi:hypothetical protein
VSSSDRSLSSSKSYYMLFSTYDGNQICHTGNLVDHHAGLLKVHPEVRSDLPVNIKLIP